MKHPIRFISIVLFLMLAVGSAWSADAGDDEACASCHDDLAAALPATAFGMPQCAKLSCQTCHDDGKAHMDAGGDPTQITTPAGATGEAVCRPCHAGDVQKRTLISGAAHASASVYCFNCHSIHGKTTAGRPVLKGDPPTLCLSCHVDKKAAFDRPYGHRIERSGVTCVSCHDPHGGMGEKSLELDSSGQGPCVTCHAEKRGPFVFAHAGDKAGSCLTCHEHHGSVKPSALIRTRVDQLCLECHSALTGGTLGSQPPSIHDLRSPRYRECTVCHVAIHGSNSSALFLK